MFWNVSYFEVSDWIPSFLKQICLSTFLLKYVKTVHKIIACNIAYNCEANALVTTIQVGKKLATCLEVVPHEILLPLPPSRVTTILTFMVISFPLLIFLPTSLFLGTHSMVFCFLRQLMD